MGRRLLLTVGDSHWAVPLEQACEVFVAPPVTPVPSSPAALVGICHRRGELLPVVSLPVLTGAGAGTGDAPAVWMVVVGAAGGRAAIPVTQVPTVVDDREDVPRLDVEEVLTPARIAGGELAASLPAPSPGAGGFLVEAGARLEALAAGLRRLETGLDPNLVAALAGEAHALTEGSAAMALVDVSGVAHAMEELLAELQAGTRPASAALVGALLQTATDLGVVIEAIPDGDDHGEALAELRAGLEPFLGAARPPASGSSPSVGVRCQKATPNANGPSGAAGEVRGGATPDPRAPGPTTVRCLLFEAGGRAYALPMGAVAVLATGVEPGPVWSGGRPVAVIDLRRVLEPPAPAGPAGPVVVVNGSDRSHGFRVDALVGPRDVMVGPLPPLAGPNLLVGGASIEPDGSVLCVLDGAGLVERAGSL